MDKVIIFPTDTVYGIGCSVFDKDSIKRIYEIKKRPYDKPLAVLCANVKQIENIAIVDEITRKLINNYLPGALTIIIPAKDNIKESMNLEMVGVRIPNCKIALDILNELGPMATTSVNDSGYTPINEYEEIVKKYSEIVDHIYDTNEISSNISSTVIMVKNGKITLIREGQIPFDEILNV